MGWKQIEINLYGEELKDGETLVIFGESRSRIYGKDVEDFDWEFENVSAGILHRIYKFMFDARYISRLTSRPRKETYASSPRICDDV